MSDSLPFSPITFAVLSPVLWCAVCFLTSLMSGWFALSKRFRAQSEPYGDLRIAGPLFCTVYMRFRTRYSKILCITVCEEGLFFHVMFLFRVGHPPLHIPWGEIQMRRGKYFWFPQVFLTLGNEEKIPMRIPEHLARKLGLLERIPNLPQVLPPAMSTQSGLPPPLQ